MTRCGAAEFGLTPAYLSDESGHVRYGDPLLLAAAELRGEVIGAIREADRGQDLSGIGLPPAGDQQRHRHVLRGRQGRSDSRRVKPVPSVGIHKSRANRQTDKILEFFVEMRFHS